MVQANLRTTNERSDSKLSSLNSLSPSEAQRELLKCCGSKQWAQRMVEARPFNSVDELTRKADRIWWALETSDWLEAFRSHPRIGEKKAAATISAESQKWSEAEQAGVQESTRETIESLQRLNDDYEEKFGYIYIVCATGKSSEEMLAILSGRLGNDPDKELRVAAAEQVKITELRLTKLIDT
jgi:OHCU decarboxylase